ncbi:DUF2513 domain-containing protein [Pseudomonas nitroreducens]|uniref:DUF2513 domain-containing protein n=1 Tax=Pseudomonas nitroreducens TaxID=46680 RepID=UPI0014745F6A|nr:DUF2513 domain-containing protein [Pseudomonas nitroreducens]NMZ73412.1 DUF2513 domain-containing protein [Pseudomonas nitroreducens]
MQRDMDLIRKIVLVVNDLESGAINSMEGVDQFRFTYHAKLLIEAGLAEGVVTSPVNGQFSGAKLWRLTWSGHDFADSIKDDTLWKKAKDNVIKPSASWSFNVLLEYLKFEIRRRIPGLEQ